MNPTISDNDIQTALYQYTLQLADSSMILSQRLSEWCGHGPVLEQDIALTNIALDLLGEARSLYQYAAEISGTGKTEDDLVYMRNERNFLNPLLVEQPNGDWAQTILRQFFFDAYHYHSLQLLQNCNDSRIAAVAEKSLKEASYHFRWSAEWVIRLGDGTDVSHEKIAIALNELWQYTGELTTPSKYETTLAAADILPDMTQLGKVWKQEVEKVLLEATLPVPEEGWMHQGGKTGTHTEHLGFLLAEMQFVQRAYPGLKW